MSERKTYYGPWLDELPKDAPDGSLWQVKWRSVDDNSIKTTDQWIASLDNRLHIGIHAAIQGHVCLIHSYRRVYPPGSVLPEPRPLVVDGNLRPDDDCHWMVKLSPVSPWICVGSLDLDYEMTDDLSQAICYPVQPLNGAMVPVPWPDSGCTTE